jgi:hypothetical protein
MSEVCSGGGLLASWRVSWWLTSIAKCSASDMLCVLMEPKRSRRSQLEARYAQCTLSHTAAANKEDQQS